MSLAALEYAMSNFHGSPYQKGGSGKAGIGSCHLIHEGLKNAGIDVPFLSTEEWRSSRPTEFGFKHVSIPKKGDIVVFGGHVAFFLYEGMVYTSSIRGGVNEVEPCWFGTKASEMQRQNGASELSEAVLQDQTNTSADKILPVRHKDSESVADDLSLSKGEVRFEEGLSS